MAPYLRQCQLLSFAIERPARLPVLHVEPVLAGEVAVTVTVLLGRGWAAARIDRARTANARPSFIMGIKPEGMESKERMLTSGRADG